MKAVDLIREIKNSGAVLLRHGSKHDIYINRVTQAIASVPRHGEIKEITAKGIIRKLRLPNQHP